MDRVTGDYNDFWAGRDYLNDMEPLKAAVLMAHAFNDWNVVPEHSVRILEAVKAKGVPYQSFFHQGGHGGPPPVKQMNRWFTRYLFEEENGVEKDPKAWVVREGDKQSEPTPYADYPNPEAAPVTLYLGAGGQQQGALSLKQNRAKIREKIVDNYSFSGAMLAQAEDTNHRLLFVTPELKEPLHLSGYSKIKIRLASNKPAANLSVWLVSLPWPTGNRFRQPKITDNLITRGWADPQNTKSNRERQPLKPGEFVDLSFDLQPDDQILAKGQKIGLMIFSSDREFTLQPKPGTAFTTDVSGTTLNLHVVG